MPGNDGRSVGEHRGPVPHHRVKVVRQWMPPRNRMIERKQRAAERPKERKPQSIGRPPRKGAIVDEPLRLHPPVWNMGRTVTGATEVRGESLCPGEKVMLVYGASSTSAAT